MDMTPLPGGQRRVLYWFDDTLSQRPGRNIIVHNAVIARSLKVNVRRVIESIRALEQRGYVQVTPRFADHGGADANEYLVMPANPRKQQIIHKIADIIGQDPFQVLDYLSRLAQLRTERDVGDMTLRELSDALRYKDGSDTPYIGPFIDACKEVGISPSDFDW